MVRNTIKLVTVPRKITETLPVTEVSLHALELPDHAGATLALTAPAGNLGVTWDPEALTAAVTVSGRYPHAIQLIGEYAWEAAGYPESGNTITESHVQKARKQSHIDLLGLYRSRISRLTPAETAIVEAMAVLSNGPVPETDIEGGLQAYRVNYGTAKRSLLDRGFIQAPDLGTLSFTVPGFAEYVAEYELEETPDWATAEDPR